MALLRAATKVVAHNIIVSNFTKSFRQKHYFKETGVLNKGESVS